jgi:hypothetical protein
VPRPKRPAATKQIDSLEDRRLAGPVGTLDQIDAGMELHLGSLEAPEIVDLQLAEEHANLRGASA